MAFFNTFRSPIVATGKNIADPHYQAEKKQSTFRIRKSHTVRSLDKGKVLRRDFYRYLLEGLLFSIEPEVYLKGKENHLMQRKIVPASVIDFITNNDNFAIIGHEEPDGDCIGSQFSLHYFLTQLGKKSRLYNPGPFRRTEIKSFGEYFSPRIPKVERKLKPNIIVVDCSTIDRIGGLSKDIADNDVCVIDHHASGNPFGQYRYIDISAPSVTFMIYKIMQKMGYTPNTEVAHHLLFGLCTDTGFFKHLGSHTGDVFRAVSVLVDSGTSTREIYSIIFGGKSLNSRKYIATLLNRVESIADGQFLITYETQNDLQSLGEENRDSDMLYDLLLSVQECRALALVKEESEKRTSVSLRSKVGTDVGAIAEKYSGGGHKQAAGFDLQKNFKTVIKELKNVFIDYVNTV